MAKRTIRIGGYRYEHTEALFDGRVTIEGVNATFESSPLISGMFRKMAQNEYDVSEFGFTYFLRSWDTEELPFLALPIFPNRNFCHSAIYMNTDSGIREPRDLVGKTIGEFALYGHDAGVWPNGIPSDKYGVELASCKWIIGGTNYPISAFDWIPQPVPEGVDVRHAADGENSLRCSNRVQLTLSSPSTYQRPCSMALLRSAACFPTTKPWNANTIAAPESSQ